MISFKNLTTGHSCPNIKPTIFPDKTSQVWQLPEELLKGPFPHFEITWHFENEGEIIQLLQLNQLLSSYGSIVELVIPYFPYARQDKAVTNESTFAQNTILGLLDHYFDCTISVFDIHNQTSAEAYDIDNIEATKHIVRAIRDSQADLLCFPDKGAAARYPNLLDHVIADKVRDQTTGKILGHELLETKHSLEGKTVLVVDDLCDGGATFISVAKMLYSAGAANVDLYISHGIFSKGVHLLTELGKIRNFYTTDSYLPSQEMLKKHNNVTIYKLEE